MGAAFCSDIKEVVKGNHSYRTRRTKNRWNKLTKMDMSKYEKYTYIEYSFPFFATFLNYVKYASNDIKLYDLLIWGGENNKSCFCYF